MTFSTGIFLTAVRMYEPLFRVLILQLTYQFFGQIYEPQLSDAAGIEELKNQDKALNSILTSSLNVELVYVVLKSITSFNQIAAIGSNSGKIMATHADGLVISATSDQEPPKEIDLTADQLTFERQTIEECKKKRIQTLNQIEIKMVDKAADKKISEFMYQGMDHTDENEIDDPLE